MQDGEQFFLELRVVSLSTGQCAYVKAMGCPPCIMHTPNQVLLLSHVKRRGGYVDLRKAFDSVNRDVLWRILALRGIPPKLVNLISSLYSGTESAARCDGTISDHSPVNN